MLRRIRLRDTASVIAEMRMMYDKYGCRGFMFFDDELNVNPKVIELMEAIYDLCGAGDSDKPEDGLQLGQPDFRRERYFRRGLSVRFHFEPRDYLQRLAIIYKYL